MQPKQYSYCASISMPAHADIGSACTTRFHQVYSYSCAIITAVSFPKWYIYFQRSYFSLKVTD